MILIDFRGAPLHKRSKLRSVEFRASLISWQSIQTHHDSSSCLLLLHLMHEEQRKTAGPLTPKCGKSYPSDASQQAFLLFKTLSATLRKRQRTKSPFWYPATQLAELLLAKRCNRMASYFRNPIPVSCRTWSSIRFHPSPDDRIGFELLVPLSSPPHCTAPSRSHESFSLLTFVRTFAHLIS